MSMLNYIKKYIDISNKKENIDDNKDKAICLFKALKPSGNFVFEVFDTSGNFIGYGKIMDRSKVTFLK